MHHARKLEWRGQPRRPLVVVVQTDNKMTESCCRKLRCRSVEGTDRHLQFMRQLEREGRHVQVQASLLAGDSMVASRQADALSRVTTTWYNFAMRMQHVYATLQQLRLQEHNMVDLFCEGATARFSLKVTFTVEGNIHRDRGGSPVDQCARTHAHGIPRPTRASTETWCCGCFHLLANCHERSNAG